MLYCDGNLVMVCTVLSSVCYKTLYTAKYDKFISQKCDQRLFKAVLGR